MKSEAPIGWRRKSSPSPLSARRGPHRRVELLVAEAESTTRRGVGDGRAEAVHALVAAGRVDGDGEVLEPPRWNATEPWSDIFMAPSGVVIQTWAGGGAAVLPVRPRPGRHRSRALAPVSFLLPLLASDTPVRAPGNER